MLSGQVKVITSQTEWRSVLSCFKHYDFAHTYDFHRLSTDNGEGQPLAYTYYDDNGLPSAFWPTLKRKIGADDLYDLTSAYGHVGPIFQPGPAYDLRAKKLFEAMRLDGAISLFSRMHPLFVDALPADLKGERLGDVVAIEVQKDQEVLAGYRASHRREIRGALSKGVRVSVQEGEGAAEDFYSIYHQTMVGLNASKFYFFDLGYIKSMLCATDFSTKIIFAEYEGKKIAASMFVIIGDIMQYYLSGSVWDYRHLSPSKVIIAEAHRLAIDLKLKHVVLGGGLGSTGGALFDFKKGFSKLTYPFYTTRKILDQNRYAELCHQRNVDPSATDFFPAYRA